MVANSFRTTSGNQAWDVAGNWTGGVPGVSDAVSITGSASNASTVQISSADPAYTVASLAYVAQNASMPEELAVSGSLTVTGSASFDGGILGVQNGGSATLQGTTTLSNFADVQVGGTSPGYLALAILQGTGTNSFAVFSGAASVAIAKGSTNFTVEGGTLTVGATSGTDVFGLAGGTLSLGTSATSLTDTIDPTAATAIDLTEVVYQSGETTLVTQTAVTAGYTQYSVQIDSAAGRPMFTFNQVDEAGSAPAPIVSLASDANGGTLVNVACYAAGTYILTPAGEVAAERLQPGDHVVTAAGHPEPIVWVGRRSYAGRFLAGQPHLLPIRIRAGALGAGLPRRDLLVSPCHAMFLDGVLVPAASLVNGGTIVRERAAQRVDYIHIELARHDLILAEGAPSETFVDDGSRGLFHDAAGHVPLHPAAAEYCAPRLTDGYEVEAIRNRLASHETALAA